MRTRFASTIVIASAVGAAFAVGISLWAQAPTPLTPAQSVAPAGGSANADTAKAAAKGGGRGRGPAVPAGPTPRLPDGHPDLVGIYGAPNGPVGDIAAGMAIVPCDTPGAVQQAAGRGGRGAAKGGAPAAPVCREGIPLSAEGKRVLATQYGQGRPRG